MFRFPVPRLLVPGFFACLLAAGQGVAAPNIVLVLADDMGIGDVGAYAPEGKIPTPHLDRLAAEGVRFTDMHAGASWCTPSRYALLTGRFPWRYAPGFKKRDGYAGHLIGPEEPTLPRMLAAAGYDTACIGKWHLGLGPKDGGPDYAEGTTVPFGPGETGFGHSYILPASLDIPPYVYLEDGVPTAALSGQVEDHESEGMRWAAGEFWRGGAAVPGFDFVEVLPHFRDRVVGYLEERQGAEKPFFLYFPLTAPHTPWMPTEAFRGVSGAGMYGDFVAQVDGVVGDVLGALDKTGLAGDTLVIFSSDNGAFWTKEEKAEFGHLANGPYRGGKLDAWEGGHRVPFIARWPGTVPAGSECGALAAFPDLMATLGEAAAVGDAFPAASAVDSRSFLAALKRPAQAEKYGVRDWIACDVQPGWHVRERDWKLITFLGSGGFTPPKVVKPEPGGPAGQLYDLASDPGEQENRFAEEPAVVGRLEALREKNVRPMPQP